VILPSRIAKLRFQHVTKCRRAIMGFVGVFDYLGSYANWYAVIYWYSGQTVNPILKGQAVQEEC
jgi:hypothetical protein